MGLRPSVFSGTREAISLALEIVSGVHMRNLYSALVKERGLNSVLEVKNKTKADR